MAIGQLLRDIELETIEDLLELTDLNSVGRQLDRKVRKNAEKYYKSEDFCQVVNEILRQETKRV